MLTVTKAFYYVSLETGSILIGWLGSIVYLALSILWIAFPLLSNEVGVLFIVQVIGCFLLEFGVMKKYHLLIVPWLFGQVLFNFALFFIAITVWIHLPILTALCASLVATVGIIIQLYFWICVYSLFEKIQYTRSKKYRNLQHDGSVDEGV